MDFQLISFPLQALIFFQTGVRKTLLTGTVTLFMPVFFLCVFFS